MIHELQSAVSPEVVTGLGQAAAAVVLCAAVVMLCRLHAVHVEREAALSIARGLGQMVCVGLVLAFVLHSGLPVGALILALMMVATAFTAARRLKGMDGALLLCLWAIVAGSGAVILTMLATGSLAPHIWILVPVGSMMIANAMNACA